MILSYQEALDLCLAAAGERRLDQEVVPLPESTGRVVAADIHAPLAIQPFDNAAMDGYALHHADLAAAAAAAPVQLPCRSTIAAGEGDAAMAVARGFCVRIMTGAPMPAGADAVVQHEKTASDAGLVRFTAPCAPHENVRLAGEDFRPGDPVLSRGDIIRAHHILPLATLGIGHVAVVKRPCAAVITTGKELVNDLGAPLPCGMIYNSNHPYIRTALTGMGANIAAENTVADDPAALTAAISWAMRHGTDFIVSSGAVSAGDFDFVRPVLEKLGATILFHKMRIKPGKPNLLAMLPNGCLYFGLPGNPVATAVALRFLVQQVVRKMCGMDSEKPLFARAMNRFSKSPGLHMFLKGAVEGWEDGSLTVDILEGQASFMVSPFLHMNAWVSVAEDIREIRAGQVVPIFPMMAGLTAELL